MYYYQNFTLTFTGYSRCEISILNEWIGELATEGNKSQNKKVSENMEFVIEK